MLATRNTSLTNISAVVIGKADDILNSDFICSSNLIRVVAIEESRIRSSNCSTGDGFLIPEGAIEYFQTKEGEILTIEGEVNISSIG